MRTLALALLFCAGLSAQTFSFYVDSSSGALPTDQLQSLTSLYSFPDTPAGNAASTVVRVVNTGSAQAQLNVIYVGASAGSATATPNFSVTGFQTSSIIAPGDFKLFTINFTPSGLGMSYGYLQASTGSGIFSIATLVGNGLTPQLTLSCNSSLAPQCNGATLQPNSASAIDFGTISTASSLTIPFMLKNSSGTAVNPQDLISIATTTNNPNSSFALSTLPDSLAPGSSLTFNLIFAPGAAVTYKTNLLVGSSMYPIQATGKASVVGDISSLVVTYTDSTGVRLTAQAATAISFGSAVVGGSNSNTFTFTISNPATTIDAVSVTTLSVTGSGFALTSGPTLPVSIAPGGSTTFKVVFTPTSVTTYSGVLTIGTRQFNLTGQGTASPIPDPSFQLDVNPLVNQKQVHLTINLSSAATITAAGTLTLTFTPSIDLAKDDPAVTFVSTGGRQLGVAVVKGAQTVTYNGQPSITFQTGTTAGTLKLTLEFPDQLSYSQSYTLAPAVIHISSATAVSQPPYLVVNMTGYDNTYSAGKMLFSFYDASGAALISNPMTVDATTDFRNYFSSTNNQAGGAFILQLKFPITGDITKIANLGIVMNNSAGSTNVNQTSN